MKIRLTTDLPISIIHGCRKGKEFDVIRFENRGRGQNGTAIFIGARGEECAAFQHEYEEVTA